MNQDEYNFLGTIIEKTKRKDAVAIEKARQEAWNVTPLMKFFRAAAAIEFLFLTLFVIGVLYEKEINKEANQPVVETSVKNQTGEVQ